MTSGIGPGDGIPTKYQNFYAKAMARKLPPRQAIKAKCLECCGWHRLDGGDDRIANCGCRACLLWPYRPFQNRRQRKEAVGLDTSAD